MSKKASIRQASMAVSDYLAVKDREPREAQILLADSAQMGLDADEVVVAEAATGTGKGLVIAATAAHYAERDLVIVAAPTHAILQQIISDYERIQDAHDVADYHAIKGRGEFLSENLVNDWLDDHPEHPASEIVSYWLKDAASHDWLRDTLDDKLSKAGFALPLVELTTLLAAPDDEDRGYAAYQEQRAIPPTAGVIFTTHAMVSINNYKRIIGSYRDKEISGQLVGLDAETYIRTFNALYEDEAILPHAGTLLLDEAHLFGDSMENVFSSSQALSTSARIARATGNSKSVSVINALSDHLAGRSRDGRALFLTDKSDATARKIQQYAGILTQLGKSKSKKADDRMKRLCREHGAAINRWLRTTRAERMDVRYSPSKHHPSICVRPSSLKRPFGVLWESYKRVGLFSATLYVPGTGGGMSSRFIRKLLQLPQHRTREFPPIQPSWVTDPVVMHWVDPKDKASAALHPPSESSETDSEANAVWHQAMADKLVNIASSARGGTLVLCPSYRTASRLGDLLRGSLGERLLVSQSNETFSALKEKFLHSKRPVWISTGKAWTGIDLTDHACEATKDMTLTDLVIPRLPLAPPSGNVADIHVNREKSALKFKQGIGRLVRREGVKGRNLWILDPRIHEAKNAIFARQLNNYRGRRRRYIQAA